ncbi:MAG: biotin carboxylase N-terminal domain-containing protein [Myxococcaceae bacterium]
MFKRILIANRGEIAARILRTCQELQIESVCVYSEADAQLGYLKNATKSICIGEAPASKSYLNQNILLKTAHEEDCEALHPGYGFLSENALFATRCEQQKLTFIGPKPHQIRIMGDKATAIRTMKAAGLPVLPGSSKILNSQEEALETAQILGYPVLLKATAGGGGKGMRLVHNPQELPEAYLEARTEAEKSFSNPELYLEKYISNARHIEFQVLADAYGKVIHLGERECSVQKRHQKLLEEAPAPNFPESLREKIGDQIIEALSKIGYLGAGTLEFLLDTENNLYFMEMNTRIQVEHPVTELVTGLDLIAWQIKIAAGEHLNINYQGPVGHSIECRINAEAPGTVTKLKIPENIRFDSYLEQNTQVTPYYDSMVGKLISYAPTRAEAIQKLQEALKDLVIEGVPTTQALHQAILQEQPIIKGQYSCAFMERFKWPK